MFGSAVLDTVIGLAFVFLLVALLSSTIAEWLANLLRKRAKFLLRGVAAMLAGDQRARPLSAWTPAALWTSVRSERALYRDVLRPTAADAADDVVKLMSHPLIKARRQTDPDGRYTRLPAYLPASDVAAALIETVLRNPAVEEIEGRITELGGTPLGRVLATLWAGAGSDRARFVTAIEGWYDAQMERVSGWYKRWVKRWIVVIGVVVAVGLGVDTVAVATALYSDTAVRETVVAAAGSGELCGDPATVTDCARAELNRLDTAGLPVGWPATCPGDLSTCVDGGPGEWLRTLLGLALTAVAAAVGAPFWFDVLGRLGSLRNTGDRPEGTNPAP